MFFPMSLSMEGHREMGACCKALSMSHLCADPREHSSQLEVIPAPKGCSQKDGARKWHPHCTDGELTHRWQWLKKKDIMAHKKCMVEQGLTQGGSSRSYAGAAAGVGMA